MSGRVIKDLYPQHLSKINVAVADRLMFLMDKKGWDRKKLATQLGVNPSSINKWFTGEQNFQVSTLAALGQVFGEPIIEVVAEQVPVD